MKGIIYWRNKKTFEVNSVEELDARLDNLLKESNQEQPDMATLETEAGTLVIGLGKHSVLSYNSPEDKPPYYVSVGDQTKQGITTFSYDGEATEMHNRNLIGLHEAREAVRDFFRSGKLPQNVKWEEV